MKKPKNIDEYIDGFDSKTQALLQKIRKTIQKSAPGAIEAISYGIPTFKLNGNLVHFAGYKNHIGFYPGAAGVKAFAKKFKNYKYAKGSVQFPIEESIPYDLIAEIVEFRIKQQMKTKN